MYNFNTFSKKVKFLREKNNYSQAEVSNLAMIDKKTLSRIENGKVIPKLETLEVLSSIYNTDLLELLIESRINDYDFLQNIITNIEYKINNRLIQQLTFERENLLNLLYSIDNNFIKTKIQQIIYFIDSILSVEKSEFNQAKISIIKSISLTVTNFSVNNFKDYIYNAFELRLLMLLATVFYNLKETNLYYSILEFIYSYADTSNYIFPTICINLSNVYIRNKNYKMALEIIKSGIDSSLKYNNYNSLELLYYAKGASEYFLAQEQYIDSFNKALAFCDITNRDQVKKEILIKLDKYFNFIP